MTISLPTFSLHSFTLQHHHSPSRHSQRDSFPRTARHWQDFVCARARQHLQVWPRARRCFSACATHHANAGTGASEWRFSCAKACALGPLSACLDVAQPLCPAGADCLSKWVGEAERQLRLLFDQVDQRTPAVASHGKHTHTHSHPARRPKRTSRQ